MGGFIDLTGEVFGKLTVIDRADNKAKKTYWSCICSCGGNTIVRSDLLRDGRIRSCGCLQKEATSTHGLSQTYIYNHWNAMINRCTNQNHEHYDNYGGRGIKVCDRWLASPLNFFEDMGDRPSKHHSVDRIDPDGNYEPSNCRWATRKEQNRNQHIYKTNKSGIKGVSWIVRDGIWRTTIGVNGKKVFLGNFSSLEDAAKAREQAEIQYWNKS